MVVEQEEVPEWSTGPLNLIDNPVTRALVYGPPQSTMDTRCHKSLNHDFVAQLKLPNARNRSHE